MNKQIKELAKQAGCLQHGVVWVANDSDFERFAKLVQANERDVCGKIIKDMVEQGFMDGHALKAVKAIIARGEK